MKEEAIVAETMKLIHMQVSLKENKITKTIIIEVNQKQAWPKSTKNFFV